MGAGQGTIRRVQALVGRQQIPTVGFASKVLQVLDKMASEARPPSGWSSKTIASQIFGDGCSSKQVKEVDSALRVLEEHEGLVSSKGGTRAATTWALEPRNAQKVVLHDFGKGEVFAYRHRNGGGWVAQSAKVEVATYIGPWATVTENATVGEDVVLTDSSDVGGAAVVDGEVIVSGAAEIYGDARVSEEATVSGAAKIFDHAEVRGAAQVSGCTQICGAARVGGRAKIEDAAIVTDHAKVTDYATVKDDAQVYADAEVEGEAIISENAVVNGKAVVCGKARVAGRAKVGGHNRIEHGLINGDKVIDDRSPIRIEDSELTPLSF